LSVSVRCECAGLETRTTAGLETGATGFRGARAMDVSIARGMALIRSALHGGGLETPATAGRETGATSSRGARGGGESAPGAEAQILGAFYGTSKLVP